MREHLKADYETHQIEQSRPAFHKIGFDDTSVYLTKSYFYEAGIPATGKNSKGNYRLFSWADMRAKAFLGFELGQESPALGMANVIGSFTPVEGDICNVKYATSDGKAFYKSARFALTGEGEDPKRPLKIDAEHFMEMKEIIPTGAQGKAIYGEGNYIIDGAAGTGKSTTVLQKLKLLQLHNNVEANQIAIVVKNASVVSRFQKLLSSIGINGISIFTVEEIVNKFHSDNLALKDCDLEDMYSLSLSVVGVFNAVCNVQKLTSYNYKVPAKEYDTLVDLVASQKFKTKLDSFIQDCKVLQSYKTDEGKEFGAKQKEIVEAAERLTKQLTLKKLNDKQKALGNRILGVLGLSPKLGELSLAEETQIRDQVGQAKKSKQNLLAKEKAKFHESVSEKVNKLNDLKSNLLSSLIEQVCIINYPAHSKIQELYLNKCVNRLSLFHTIIIDEAQDVSGRNIEFIRLLSNNTILTGDELQRENITGIGSWNKILISEPFIKDEELNLFELRHNFRQTYELGLVSYNYRRLMLGKGMFDIRSEYFDDQIGFENPKLVEVSKVGHFLNLVQDRITYINESFTRPFPLVVFYETREQLETFSSILKGSKINYGIDSNELADADVLFVDIKDIAGREFPVVICPINMETNAATLYIMLSRPKFNLIMFSKDLHNIDQNILALCDEGYVEKKIRHLVDN
jgi:DNA helicase IV